jgi:capsular polysaccharide biosynthesis protein
MNDVVKFQDIFIGGRAIYKRLGIIICISLITFLIGILVTLKPINNTYAATATVYSATYGSYEQSLKGAVAMNGYVDLITSNKVCERALELIDNDSLDAKKVQAMISVSDESDSESAVRSITASSKDYELAIHVANAVAESFAVEVGNIAGESTIRVLDEATTYQIDVNGKQQQWLIRLLFMAAGFLLTGTIIYVTEFFSNKLNIIEQCSLDGTIDILGIVPKLEQEV